MVLLTRSRMKLKKKEALDMFICVRVCMRAERKYTKNIHYIKLKAILYASHRRRLPNQLSLE